MRPPLALGRGWGTTSEPNGKKEAEAQPGKAKHLRLWPAARKLGACHGQDDARYGECQRCGAPLDDMRPQGKEENQACQDGAADEKCMGMELVNGGDRRESKDDAYRRREPLHLCVALHARLGLRRVAFH